MTSLTYKQMRFFRCLWNQPTISSLHISPLTQLTSNLPSMRENNKVNVLNLASLPLKRFGTFKSFSFLTIASNFINESIYQYCSNLPPHVRAVLDQDRDDSDSDLEDFNALNGADSDSDKEFVDDDSGYLFTSDSDEELLVSEKSDSDVEV